MKPIELTAAQVRSLRYAEGKVQAGGVWGTLESGMTCRAAEGRRVILIASNDQMYYLVPEKNKVYAQDTTSFIQDLNAYPFTEGARRALGMARLARAQIEFMLGLAGMVVPGAALVIAGTDLVKFAATNGRLIVAVGRACHAITKVNVALMVYAPTLQTLLQAAFLRAVWEGVKSVPGLAMDSKSAMGASVADEAAGRLAGAVLGKLSVADFTNKAGIAKALLGVLLAIVLKAAPVAAKAVALKARQGDQAVIGDLIAAARRMGVTIYDHEGRKIVEELRRSGPVVQPLLEDAIRALEAVAKQETALSAA